ncbi:MAG: hypothetical protein JSV93_01180 [Candidatus Omnitrophota bacterium]|nr:MAG: hypothetical protein JSV93_01180 [Candidatus Omnitrophota bacterium]
MSGKSFLRVILSVDIIVIIVALALGKAPHQYFEEGGFITYFSFFQLLAISVLSWRIFTVRKGGLRTKFWNKTFFIWLIIAVLCIYLSLDEVFMIHENIDFLIHRGFKIRETSITDRIDDFIVGCYALFALIILYFYREEFKKHRKVLPILKTAFIFIFFMVAMDMLTNRNDYLSTMFANSGLAKNIWSWSSAFEDMLKIIAEGMLVGVFYYCLETAKQTGPESP